MPALLSGGRVHLVRTSFLALKVRRYAQIYARRPYGLGVLRMTRGQRRSRTSRVEARAYRWRVSSNEGTTVTSTEQILTLVETAVLNDFVLGQRYAEAPSAEATIVRDPQDPL